MEKLELVFALQKKRSVLKKYNRLGSLFVQKGFYPEGDSVIHVYILNPSGGMVGGDSLLLDVQLESNSHVLLTTPGSTKFYRTNGLCAVQKNIFKLSKNSVLEWVPQSSIFFPKTNAVISTDFFLEKGARMIAFDMLCYANLTLNNFVGPEEINIISNVYLSKSVGLQERLKINYFDYLIKLGGCTISAVLFAVPANKTILNKVRIFLQRSMGYSQIGGVTLLDELLVVRLLGNDNEDIERILFALWNILRLKILGKQAIIPRVWLM